MTFFDNDGKPIHENGLEAVKRIDYSQRIPDAPIHRGFDLFFGTACCPTTDWLYAWVDGDRIPVPPTHIIDRSSLPKHPYSRDNRPGMIAPDFDLEEIDMVLLDRSQRFLQQHKLGLATAQQQTAKDVLNSILQALRQRPISPILGKDDRLDRG